MAASVGRVGRDCEHAQRSWSDRARQSDRCQAGDSSPERFGVLRMVGGCDPGQTCWDRPGVSMSSPMSVPGEPAERRRGAVAAGGFATDEERVVLRDGSEVVIGDLAAGDEATIDMWFEGL